MAISEQKIVGSDEWVSVNTLIGVAVGTEMEITVTSMYGVQVWEGTKPTNDFRGGKPLSSMKMDYAVVKVEAGSEEIWITCVDKNKQTKISVSY